MPDRSNHTCHALGCEVNVPPRMRMCAKHWRMVPKDCQDALWANYKRGQERTMSPSPAYLRAAADCVIAVGKKEGWSEEAIYSEVHAYHMWAEMIEDEATA